MTRWRGLVMASTLALLSTAAHAAPAAATDPTYLPGDGDLPPLDWMMDEKGPPPSGAKPQDDVGPGPSLVLAREAAEAAMAKCLADGHKVGVAVIDAQGNLRAALSADGSQLGRVYTAVRKGLAAMEFRAPTSQLSKVFSADPSARARFKPGMAAFPGAVPLIVNGKVLGAVGASGAAPEQDQACAEAGAARIRSRLGR
ncbi:MAG TPA: heme-binding protein [Caulobacteraceae bacterium]|nr:heme-binding protein [Caulobacteraceae bacterium]